MTSTIQPEEILKQLGRLWTDLGKQEGHFRGVLRACAMTFIAASLDGDADAGETIGNLMRTHPSRAIVLHLLPDDAGRLDARVLAQCWMPFGSRQQICCEQVEISASRNTLPALPSLMSSIDAPDLPVVIWLRSPHLLEIPAFRPVIMLAHKVIVDSAPVSDLDAQLTLLASVAAPDRVVADLAWTRLTPLRELIAGVFDNPACVTCAANLERVSIGYDGHFLPMSARYLAAWVSSAVGVAIPAEFHQVEDAPASSIRYFELVGSSFTVSLTIAPNGSSQLVAGGRESHLLIPALSDGELLHQELSILGSDRVFDEVLRHAREIHP